MGNGTGTLGFCCPAGEAVTRELEHESTSMAVASEPLPTLHDVLSIDPAFPDTDTLASETEHVALER